MRASASGSCRSASRRATCPTLTRSQMGGRSSTTALSSTTTGASRQSFHRACALLLAPCAVRRATAASAWRRRRAFFVRFARVLRACAGVCVRPELIIGVTSDGQRRSIMCVIRDFCVSRPCG